MKGFILVSIGSPLYSHNRASPLTEQKHVTPWQYGYGIIEPCSALDEQALVL